MSTETARLGLDEPQSTDNISAFPADDAQALGQLDQAVLVTQGTLANRPSASSTPYGNEYYATDAGQYSRCNGTSWDTIVASGDLKVSAASSPPSGWLLCNGASYSQTAYPLLYAAIGTTYGSGSGSGDFNVPDYRGRTIVGAGSGTGGNASTHQLGQTGGDEALQEHAHGVTDPGHQHGFSNYEVPVLGSDQWTLRQVANGGGYWVAGPNSNTPNNLSQITATGGASTGVSVNNAGSGSGQNMMPYAVANVFIKI